MRISDWSSDVCSSDLAEVAVDLVHALEATDDQALEVELRRHAQEQVQVERVVMRGERLGRRTTGQVMHHRRLDFEEAPRVEPATDRADHLRALDEHLARVDRKSTRLNSSH